MFNQLKSLFQLPSQLKQARQSEQQAELLRQKLQQTTAPVAPVAPVIPPAVSGGISAPIVPPTVPPVVPPIVPPVIPPASPQVNPQIEAINASLSNLSSGLKDFSAGLTPPTPSTPNDYQSQLKAIQDKILASSAPTTSEEDLTARINALMGRTEASNILTGGEPISANAITGRREALTREQQAQLVPLQRQIGLEQAKRAAAIDVETKRAGFLEPLIKEQAEKRKPFELSAGQQRYEYDPLTGKMEMVAKVAAKETLPSDVQEYKFAQSQGYKGTYMDYRRAKVGVTEINAENYDRAKQEATDLFEIDRQRNADKKISPDLYQAMRNKIPVTLKDDFDEWAVDMDYLSEETKRRFGIPIKKSGESKSRLEMIEEKL